MKIVGSEDLGSEEDILLCRCARANAERIVGGAGGVGGNGSGLRAVQWGRCGGNKDRIKKSKTTVGGCTRWVNKVGWSTGQMREQRDADIDCIEVGIGVAERMSCF